MYKSASSKLIKNIIYRNYIYRNHGFVLGIPSFLTWDYGLGPQGRIKIFSFYNVHLCRLYSVVCFIHTIYNNLL